jgi:hypothetical protein
VRTLLALAASLLLPFAAAGAQPPGAGERYTPVGIWANAEDAEFYEGWFGPRLRAMGEPILSRSGDRQRFRRRFRMLVIPHYSRPWAVRIDERNTGGAMVRRVELDGPGAARMPRSIRRQKRFGIGRDDIAALELRFALARLRDFALLEEPPTPPVPEIDPATGEVREHEIAICFHGTQYVFELVDEAGYHMIQRSRCHMPPELLELIRTLRRLHWNG